MKKKFLSTILLVSIILSPIGNNCCFAEDSNSTLFEWQDGFNEAMDNLVKCYKEKAELIDQLMDKDLVIDNQRAVLNTMTDNQFCWSRVDKISSFICMFSITAMVLAIPAYKFYKKIVDPLLSALDKRDKVIGETRSTLEEALSQINELEQGVIEMYEQISATKDLQLQLNVQNIFIDNQKKD